MKTKPFDKMDLIISKYKKMKESYNEDARIEDAKEVRKRRETTRKS